MSKEEAKTHKAATLLVLAARRKALETQADALARYMRESGWSKKVELKCAPLRLELNAKLDCTHVRPEILGPKGLRIALDDNVWKVLCLEDDEWWSLREFSAEWLGEHESKWIETLLVEIDKLPGGYPALKELLEHLNMIIFGEQLHLPDVEITTFKRVKLTKKTESEDED